MDLGFEIKTLRLGNGLCPGLLKEVCPEIDTLRYIGELSDSLFSFCVGVVGSRNMSLYGNRVVSYLMRKLNRQLTVVSGFTRGVDITAHTEAIRNNMKTIAVIPCGLQSKFLRNKSSLITDIVRKGGIVLTELENDFEPKNWSFVKRNRIIAGLCQSLVVIEAGEKSGALITAGYAKKYGRKIFSVPGSIFSDLSVGTNSLISLGADVLCSGAEIGEFYNSLGGFAVFSSEFGITDCDAEPDSGGRLVPGAPETNNSYFSTSKTGQVINLLRSADLSASELSALSGIPVESVNILLTDLLMQGRVVNISGRYIVNQS